MDVKTIYKIKIISYCLIVESFLFAIYFSRNYTNLSKSLKEQINLPKINLEYVKKNKDLFLFISDHIKTDIIKKCNANNTLFLNKIITEIADSDLNIAFIIQASTPDKKACFCAIKAYVFHLLFKTKFDPNVTEHELLSFYKIPFDERNNGKYVFDKFYSLFNTEFYETNAMSENKPYYNTYKEYYKILKNDKNFNAIIKNFEIDKAFAELKKEI
ncbi:hypothetical protein COBT_001631 [Conglomerata obtusa]